MEVRGLHLVLLQHALRINQQMTLAALDILAAVVSAGATRVSGFD
jgi:hypothetical protein